MPDSTTETAIPSGLRRFTPVMLAIRDQADTFAGAPKGFGKPFRYLAAFQEAEPYLGLPPQAYKLLAWLVKQTMAHDWEEGSRPICWPSAARQAEFLGLSPARVKILNRALFEAGIFIIRDSETGKRYGRRGPDGRIIEAYGFDLSPLAYRFDEFIRLAAEAKAERERMKALRKRATCARRAIRQIGETLGALAVVPLEWPQLAAETAALIRLIRRAERPDELTRIAEGLESLKIRAETWVREVPQTMKTSPVGLANEPHTIPTNKPFDPKDTVTPAEEGSRAERIEPTPAPTVSLTDKIAEVLATSQPFEQVEEIHPGELLELAPRLAAHVTQSYPDWRDIVDAAGTYLRHELGVSQALWGEACRILGRQMAAVVLAVVSTKPQEHFTRGAGGYFAAMVKRAQSGELRLDRSLWKLRRDRWGSSRNVRSRTQHSRYERPFRQDQKSIGP
jgi:replication initiation protein RepC